MNWLKTLFRKKERATEQETVLLEPSALESWFIQEKEKNTSFISQLLSTTRKEIEESIPSIETLMESLNETPLHDALLTLISQMKTACSSIEEMLALQEVLESFVANHSREKQALLGPAARSANEIFSLLEKVHATLEKSSEVYEKERENLEFLRDIHNDIKHFEKLMLKQKDLKEQLVQLNQKERSAQALKERIERDLHAIKQTHAYQEYLKLVEEKEDAQKQFSQVQQKINTLFDPLIPLLREYMEIALERPAFIESYILDPAKALLQDEGLALRNVLSSMRAAIQSGSLIAQDASQQTITTLLETLDSLQGEIKDVHTQKVRALKRFGATHYEIEDLRYKQKHALEQFEKIVEEKESLVKQMDDLAVDFYKKKIEQNIRAALDKEVHIEVNCG
ncbi:hypothetical protein D6774_01625 [Candidatus Woesearchaeota archaeon]|nr:MAG: hypothetical protein D6774_01625 [Candidatus Woesearchaeota archaeon]